MFKTTLAVILITIIATCAGCQPLATYKDNLWDKLSNIIKSTKENTQGITNEKPNATQETPVITTKIVDQWQFDLLHTKWDKNTVNIKIQVTNLAVRRIFGLLGKKDELATIDSTGKIIEPSYPREYFKEFYPQEPWVGELTFTMSPYSGNTKLYLLQWDGTRQYILFDLGLPSSIPPTPTTTAPSNPAIPKPPIANTLERIEKQTFDLINAKRVGVGLQPVLWDDNLHSGARNWSNNMQAKGELYHDSVGVHTYYFAECIYGASYSSYRTPEQTVEAWMNSSGHRTILMGSYRIGAIGIAKDSGFWATYRCK